MDAGGLDVVRRKIEDLQTLLDEGRLDRAEFGYFIRLYSLLSDTFLEKCFFYCCKEPMLFMMQ